MDKLEMTTVIRLAKVFLTENISDSDKLTLAKKIVIEALTENTDAPIKFESRDK